MNQPACWLLGKWDTPLAEWLQCWLGVQQVGRPRWFQTLCQGCWCQDTTVLWFLMPWILLLPGPQQTWYSETCKISLGKSYLKHIHFMICLADSTQSCLFSLSWETTYFERPQNLVVALYKFHCIEYAGHMVLVFHNMHKEGFQLPVPFISTGWETKIFWHSPRNG